MLTLAPIALLLTTTVSPETATSTEAAEPDLSGPAYAQLDDRERELLREYAVASAALREQYDVLSMSVLNREYKFGQNGAPELTNESRMTIYKSGPDLQRLDGSGQSDSGEPATGKVLLNREGSWSLGLDESTDEHYVLFAGGDRLKSAIYNEWWHAGPVRYRFEQLDRVFFIPTTRSRFISVQEETDESGVAMLTIVRRRPVTDDSENPDHDIPTATFWFYRDNLALQRVEATGFINGSDTQHKTIQLCHYEPFTDDTPRLSSVSVNTFTRPLSDRNDESAWEPLYRQVVDVTELDFSEPAESIFSVHQFVDLNRRLETGAGRRIEWLLIINAVACLILWILLYRWRRGRQQNRPA